MQVLGFDILFEPIKIASLLVNLLLLLFCHLADAFIQSDLQMWMIEAIQV